ncbi:MFS transporter [Paenibacillus sp. MWE-103]|uniref:MFS transporter n=1 Tax=Paenibacillus artemisiicola TaxID=1172618 RepID=A0ABS3W3P3_9BACL|nr:MFS transporter [Paenibacillus artemisiicola]MBO7742928.1 MFS transporter [Paenibacillus artemisiicola]
MRMNWRIYMLAAVSFLVGTSEYMIAGILDKIAAELGVTVAAAGQLMTAFSLAYAIGTPVLMAAAARIERRRLLQYALGLIIAGNAMILVLPGFGSLLLARVVMALGTGVFVVASLAVAAKLAPGNKQGSAIAVVLMGISASLILGVPLGRMIAAVYDWKLIFGGIGLLAALALPLVARAIPRIDSERPVPLGRQLAMMKQPRIAAALGITFFWILGYAIAFTYLSPYLLNVAGMSERWVGAALFAYGIASLIGSKAGGYGTDRWGVARTLGGGMLLNAAMLILLSASVGTPPALVLALLLLWSFFSWSSAPTQQYYLMTLSPEASGVMLGLNTSVLQLAMAAGAGIGGLVIDRLSLQAITWIAAASVAVAAAAASVLFGGLRGLRGRRRESRRASRA